MDVPNVSDVGQNRKMGVFQGDDPVHKKICSTGDAEARIDSGAQGGQAWGLQGDAIGDASASRASSAASRNRQGFSRMAKGSGVRRATSADPNHLMVCGLHRRGVIFRPHTENHVHMVRGEQLQKLG